MSETPDHAPIPADLAAFLEDDLAGLDEPITATRLTQLLGDEDAEKLIREAKQVAPQDREDR